MVSVRARHAVPGKRAWLDAAHPTIARVAGSDESYRPVSRGMLQAGTTQILRTAQPIQSAASRTGEMIDPS